MEETKTKTKTIAPHLRPEYYRITFDVLAQHPISIQRLIDSWVKDFGVEEDKVETRFAKLTLNALEETGSGIFLGEEDEQCIKGELLPDENQEVL